MISITMLHKSLDCKQDFICRVLYIEQKTISAPKNLLSKMRDNTCKFSTREAMR